jgi:hypothetical protein
MANGNLTIVSPFDEIARNHLVVLDGYIWHDFVLTTTMAPFYAGAIPTANGGILVRPLANGDWVGVLIMPREDGMAFATFDENGDFTVQSGSMVRGRDANFSLWNKGGELRVEAYGNTYILYIDDKQITSATFPGPTSGHIALWSRNSGREDETERYAPRFEDIRIESMP